MQCGIMMLALLKRADERVQVDSVDSLFKQHSYTYTLSGTQDSGKWGSWDLGNGMASFESSEILRFIKAGRWL